jgi:hypothetical protein
METYGDKGLVFSVVTDVACGKSEDCGAHSDANVRYLCVRAGAPSRACSS